MQLRDMAWASVRRRKARFAFVLAAVVLGTGTIIGLIALTRGMQAQVSAELDRFGANIVITPKSDVLDVAYGGLSLGDVDVDRRELSPRDAEAVLTIHHRRNISLVSPKVMGAATVGDARVLLVGTQVQREHLLKPWWKIVGHTAQQPGDAIVGSDAAVALHVTANDRLTIAGETLRVAGVLEPTGAIDDRSLFVDLPLAQAALGRPEAVSLIEVSALCTGCPIEEIVTQIAAVLPHAKVVAIRQAVASREQTVQQLTRFSYAVAGLLLLVGTLVVMTAMMSSVTERTQEIGILRAVGFRRTHVAGLIMLETLFVTVTGGVCGWLAGLTAARVFGPAVAQVTAPVTLDPRLAATAVLFAVVVGVAGGAYPALRAAHMDPSIALRQG